MNPTTDQPAAPQNPASGNEIPAAPPKRPRRMAREGGKPAPANVSEPTPRATSKIDRVLALLRSCDGATLEEMVGATGWLPHTTRAALTGLRKKGHVLIKDKRDGVTCYRIGEVGA